MARNRCAFAVVSFLAVTLTAVLARADEPTASLKQGKPDLKSAGPLAFGPDGILFVGDTEGRGALRHRHRRPAPRRPRSGRSQVKDLAGKVAAMLGTKPKQIMINDMAVNPRSGNVYLSVSRGRGPDATPRDRPRQRRRQARGAGARQRPVRQGRDPQRPGPGVKQRGQELRNESITDLAYVDGRVFLAGLSNEEFSSRLIAIPFPFSSEGFDGARIEIYHGAHGQFETKSPIRTFVAYQIQNEPYLLAAYTCTPLVKVPRRRAQGRRPRQGHDHRRAGQPQPSARHDRLPEGRQGLHPAHGQQQPRRHEDPDRGGRGTPGIVQPVPRQEGPRLRHDRRPQGRRPDWTSSTTAMPSWWSRRSQRIDRPQDY